MTAALSPGAEPIRLSFREISSLNERFEGASAEDVVHWGLQTFGERLVVASSFSAEDIVLIDLAVSIHPGVRVFTLDTGRLHEETYETIEAVRRHFGVNVEVLFPDREAVEELVRENGPNSFYASIADRKECCHIRKVVPLRRFLRHADAWVTGMRKEQSTTRSELRMVEMDMLNGGLVKLNPLADWSRDDVWEVVRAKGLPYNPLHDQGYPSIGCAPCTRAIADGEDERAGRWWWEEPDGRECGLHK